MTLDILDKQIEAVRARALNLQQATRAQRKTISEDPRLSHEGKDEQIAALLAHAKTQIDSLRDEEDKLANDKRASLERTILGTVGNDSSSIITYRDAQDRAEKLEKEADAARVMNRALVSGDKTLAAAIAQKALSNSWSTVYNTFAEANPATAEAAQDLATLNHYTHDIKSVMQRAGHYVLAGVSNSFAGA